MRTILVIIPYFGAWPQWTRLFLESCRANPSIDWLLVSDRPDPGGRSANVKYLPLTYREFLARASDKAGCEINSTEYYKACDIKPMLGDIFAQEAAGYDFFGWGDMDVIYGDLRKWVTDDILRDYDAVSFHGRQWISNHLLLLKNTEEMRTAYRAIEGLKEKLRDPKYRQIDDVGFSKIVFSKNAYVKESFSTPHAPLIPWTDGTRLFPTEWYWRDGILTNNRDKGREFPYFHFMAWKGCAYCAGGQWKDVRTLVHFDLAAAPLGWKINQKGFFAIEGSQVEKFFAFWTGAKLAWLAAWHRGLRPLAKKIKDTIHG